MSNKIIGNVFRTKNYDQFKRLEGNRAVLAARVTKIKKSIERNGYILNPLVVNERFEIIDGQGRFDALKELGLPIDYVIAEGAGLPECIALNASGTIWTMMDYIDSYCEMGNENYIRMRKVMSAFPDIGTQIKIMLITGLASIPNESIKKGNIRIAEERIGVAEDDLHFVRRFIPTLQRVKGTPNNYIYAIIFAKKCGASEQRLQETIERSDLPPAPKLRIALDTVSDIYNKNLKGASNRIYLYQRYEETMSDKYGWYGAKWGSGKGPAE